jgi:hypothetical protein
LLDTMLLSFRVVIMRSYRLKPNATLSLAMRVAARNAFHSLASVAWSVYDPQIKRSSIPLFNVTVVGGGPVMSK